MPNEGIQYADVEEIMGIHALTIQKQIPHLNKTWETFNEISNVAVVGGKVQAPLISGLGHSAGPKPLHKIPSDDFGMGKFTYGTGYVTAEIDKDLQEILERDPIKALGDLDRILTLREAELRRFLSIMMWTKDGSLAVVANNTNNTLTILPIIAKETLYPYDAVKYFRRKMWIDIYRGSTPVKLKAEVISVDYDLGKITVDDAGGATNGDIIYWHDCYSKPPCPGIPAMISDKGEYGGINREITGNEFWRSKIIHNAGALNTDMMDEVCDDTSKVDDDQTVIEKIITTRNVRNIAYKKLLEFTYNVNAAKGEAPKVTGGVSGYSFATPDGRYIPVEVDRLCPEGTMWFIAQKKMYLYFAKKFAWEESGLGGWRRWWHMMGIHSGDINVYRAMGSVNLCAFTNHCAVHGAILDIEIEGVAS